MLSICVKMARLKNNSFAVDLFLGIMTFWVFVEFGRCILLFARLF